MKKWTALLLVLLLFPLMLTGCGEEDPEKAAARIVLEVNGEKVTKGEADQVYDFIIKQMTMQYAQSGVYFNASDATTITNVKMQTLQTMGEDIALRQKLEELGEPLTDADRTRLEETAESEYASMASSLVGSYGMTEEAAKSELDAMGYYKDALIYMMTRDEVTNRLRDLSVPASIEIPDKDVVAKYDELVASATESYASNPSQFINDTVNGAIVYYRPEGYRYVKNIVIGMPEAVEAQITEKQGEQYDVSMEQYSAQTELSRLEGSADMTDEKRAELDETIATTDARLTALAEEIEALKQQGWDEILPTAEEVVEKARAEGGDFDALMAEYSEDTATGDLLTVGYPVGEGVTLYVQSFTDGAMALESVGDVSGPIASDYGYHILQYASDVEAGPVPIEEVRNAVLEQLRSAKQQEDFEAQVNDWLDRANIKTYISRF